VARSEARILVEIWDDADFLALTPMAQRQFMFLISQRDLEHTGVIALRERRWAKDAAGMSVEDILVALRELERGRFVVVDDDAEELLVRSFIRRDKVYKQPNVMRAAAERVHAIKSRRVREELLVELDRIVQTESMTASALEIVEGMREALAKACGNPSRNPSADGSAEPLGEATAEGSELRPGERGKGKGEEVPEQDQVSRSGEATDGTAPTTAKRPIKEGKLPSTHPNLTWSDKEIDADPLFQEFWAAYPKKDDKGQARKTWLSVLRNKDVTAQQIADGARSYRNDSRRNANWTKNASTWLNAEAWNNYGIETVEPENDPEATWLN
jgi:hypothetical protein